MTRVGNFEISWYFDDKLVEQRPGLRRHCSNQDVSHFQDLKYNSLFCSVPKTDDVLMFVMLRFRPTFDLPKYVEHCSVKTGFILRTVRAHIVHIIGFCFQEASRIAIDSPRKLEGLINMSHVQGVIIQAYVTINTRNHFDILGNRHSNHHINNYFIR